MTKIHDYLEAVNCVNCNSRHYQVVYTNLTDTDDYGNLLTDPYRDFVFELRRCLDCRTYYLGLRPKQLHISHYYAGEYHCFTPFYERGVIMNTLAKISSSLLIKKLNYLGKNSKDNILLDYGCGRVSG